MEQCFAPLCEAGCEGGVCGGEGCDCHMKGFQMVNTTKNILNSDI